MKKKVYIAGPYTRGDVCVNVAAAMDAWHVLYGMGFTPFCPHVTHFLHLHRPNIDVEGWYAYDLEWLEGCDALLRLPGDSTGADKEVARAAELGINVYYTIESLALNE